MQGRLQFLTPVCPRPLTSSQAKSIRERTPDRLRTIFRKSGARRTRPRAFWSNCKSRLRYPPRRCDDSSFEGNSDLPLPAPVGVLRRSIAASRGPRPTGRAGWNTARPFRHNRKTRNLQVATSTGWCQIRRIFNITLSARPLSAARILILRTISALGNRGFDVNHSIAVVGHHDAVPAGFRKPNRRSGIGPIEPKNR